MVFSCENDSIAHPRLFLERRFNLAKFDSESTDLHLMIDASKEL